MSLRRTLTLLLFAMASRLACAAEPEAPPVVGPGRFEGEIAELQRLDDPDSEGGVLLLGSSSIRLWASAAKDLAPYPVIRRGFGGANFEDLAHFAERLVNPHRFRAAVVFVANDVTGEGHDHTPAEVKAWFVRVVDVLRAREPGAPIVCCDVRPTPLREHVWEQTKAVNAALKEACDERAGVHYLDTAGAYWGEDGKARTDVYIEDRLHLNDAGYALWSGQVRAELDRVLGDASAVRMPVYSHGAEEPAPTPLAAVEALHAGADGAALSADRAQRPLRLVLVAGPKDHDAGEHDYPAWLDAWSRLLPRAAGTEVRTAWEFPAEADAAWADAMVFYQRGRWDAERQGVIDPFLARGGGLAYLHWAVDGRGGEVEMARRTGLSAKGGAASSTATAGLISTSRLAPATRSRGTSTACASTTNRTGS